MRESLEATQRAVQMAPNIPEGWNNLGTILKELHRIPEAVNAFRKAIALRPSYAVAHRRPSPPAYSRVPCSMRQTSA